MKTSAIMPFQGVISAINPRNIPGTAAQAALNVRVPDGALRLRYGFRNRLSAQSGFTAFHGADYVQGYSGTTLKEEFITFETVSGTTKPYFLAVNSSTGALTAQSVITNGVTDLSLSATDWVSRAWQDVAYCINPNETTSVYKHTLGTGTSFTPMAQPASPTSPLTYAVLYGGGTYASYSSQSFASVLTGDVTYTGVGTATGFAANADGSLTLGTSVAGIGSFTIDLNGHVGNLDLSYNDIFYFTLQGEPGAGTGSYNFDQSSFGIQLINADGSPVTFDAFQVDVRVVQVQQGTTPAIFGIRVEFNKYDRTLWDNIRKIVVSYWVNNNSGAKMRMSRWLKGGVWISASRNLALPRDVLFNYSYYYSGSAWESGLCAQAVTVPFAILNGYQPVSTMLGLGVHIRLTATTSGDANVDDNRFYGWDTQDDVYRRIATQADGTTTYDIKICYNEFHALTQYEDVTPFKTDHCTNAFPFRGWMIWLYQGGYQNVRHSRVGDPDRQASTLDQDDDLARGETFTLADNLADEPLGGCQAGDTAFIVGSQGVYAQVGDAPSLMTPCKRLAGAFGCAGKFAYTRWKDDSGNPGIAWMSTDGHVYFGVASPRFVGDTGGQVFPLTDAIKTGAMSPATFLRDDQSLSNFSTCRLGVDERTDSLWVVMGKRALVLRKSAGGDRYWEPYEHNIGGTWSYLAFSSRWGMQVARSTGEVDEWEWNTAAGAYITGELRDAGLAVPTPYWHSKLVRGAQNRRVLSFRIVRSDLTDTPSVTIYSERTPDGNTYTVKGGAQTVRTGITNMGRELSYKIELTDNDSVINALEVEETMLGSRPNF